MHIVSDFIFHTRTGEPRKNIVGIEKFEEEWLGVLYKHPRKQYAFIRNNPVRDELLFRNGKMTVRKMAQEVSDGTFELKKQEAVYVGLKRNRGKIDMKGKISHPFKLSKKMAQSQITKINDYFLVMGMGVKCGSYSLDEPSIEYEMKNKRFLVTLFSRWPHQSGLAVRQMRSMQKLLREEVIPL